MRLRTGLIVISCVVAIAEADHLGALGLVETLDVGAEVDLVVGVHRSLLVHEVVAASRLAPVGVCLVRLDPIGQVRRVHANPAEQRRRTRVLPGHPEQIQARRVGHAAHVPDLAALVLGLGDVDPRVIDPKPRRPDDAVVLG